VGVASLPTVPDAVAQDVAACLSRFSGGLGRSGSSRNGLTHRGAEPRQGNLGRLRAGARGGHLLVRSASCGLHGPRPGWALWWTARLSSAEGVLRPGRGWTGWRYRKRSVRSAAVARAPCPLAGLSPVAEAAPQPYLVGIGQPRLLPLEGAGREDVRVDPRGWRFVSCGFEGGPFDRRVVDPCRVEWLFRHERQHRRSPQYPDQQRHMSLPKVAGNAPSGPPRRREFSNFVWGFHVPD